MFSQDKSARHLEAEVEKVIRGRFPLDRKIGKDERQRIYTVDVSDLKFVHPDASYTKQAEAFNEDGTLESTVKATVTVQKDGKPFTTLKNVTLCIVPYPTDRGTYIINGNEKVFLHQMLRRPGIYALPTKFRSGEKTKEEVVGEIRTKRGNYQLIVDKKDGSLKATKLRFEYGVKGTATVDGISFLHLLGATDADIAKACGDDEVGQEIFKTFLKRSRKMSVQDIHEKTHVRPYESDEDTIQHIQELLNNQTFDAHSQRINEISTGRKVDHVNKDAFLAALHAMAVEIHPEKENPSLDDPRYKVVLTPEAVIARSVDKGIGEWMQSMQKSLTFNNNQDEKKEKDAFRPAGAITKTVRKTYSSSLSEAIDGGNPLDLHQKLRKVTSLGDFGLTSQSVVNSNRNLLPGMFGKVDPVETPQSGSMGVVEYLARDTEIKDGLIYSKFYRVKDGIVDAAKTIDDIDPLDEEQEYIAFNDPAVYKKHGQKWELKKGMVRVRHANQFIEVDAKKVTLIDRSPASHLSYATSAIPFAANNDGARLLMGASMQKQALPVVGAEPPLVQAESGVDGRTAEQELADNVSKNLRATVDGTISRISDTSVTIRDKAGKDHKLERLNYFSTGKNTGFINHEMAVKVGDTVKKGDLIADGWHSKKGEFSLGKNTMVAYMPYEGLNFEDGVVVSQSFADKMSSEEVKVLTIDISPDMIAVGQTLNQGGATYTVDGLLKKETKISKDQLAKLDARGIIKKGQEFKAGDVLVARYSDVANIADTEQRIRSKSKNGRFAFKPHKATGYQKGKVIDVHVAQSDEGQRVTLRFLTYKPMKDGDKLSGRHGNKGTISEIIPDAEMPRMEDGTPIELIFSPLAVPSRKNPGQLFEVNAGMLARKRNKKYVMHSFDKHESERLFKEMEEAGLGDGQFQLYNPKTGKPYENKTTVGPMYIMKLKHKTELKVTRRSTDKTGRTVDFVTNMPKKVSGSVDGERESPQAIGGMEFWSLTSAGAVHNIHEMTTLKSDGIEKVRGRIDLYDAIASGQPIPKPVTPETLKNLQDYLYGAGIRMSPMNGQKETTLDDHFTSLMLSPNKAKDAAFDGLPEVYSSKLDRATSKIDAKDLKQALGKGDDKDGRGRKLDEMSKGGLYDTGIFGEDADKWGKISLATPIANPIFLKDNNAYQALLYTSGIENKDIKSIAKGEAFYVFDPKDVPGVARGSVLSGKQLDDLMLEHETMIDAKTGGEALESLLKDVDLKKTLDALQGDIATEKKLDERSKLVNLARVVSHAVEKDYKPTDYLLHTIPVMPLKYRPSIKGKGNSVSHDDLTRLYQHVIEENLSFGQKYSGWVKESGKHDINRDEQKQALVDKSAIPSHVLLETKSDSAKILYKRVEDLVGTRSAKDSGIQKAGQRKTEDDLKGILDRLASKKGFLREKMQKKSQDFSGRSVIVADPSLDLDDVALPEDMVKKTFEPHILNELRKLGYTNRLEAMQKIEKGDSVYREAVMRVLKTNPVVLNRAPSLHKHSTQGFNVKKVYWNGTREESNAIGLNAIVTTGFNADFDGDSLLNSVFARYKEVDVKSLEGHNGEKGDEDMPMTGDSKIRYRYGLINLKDFPRGELKEAKGNKEIYHVPENIEVLTVWNNEEKWLPVESFSIHKDLEMLEVRTNTSRTLQVSNDHSLVTVDEELNYKRVPAEIGMTLPRLRKPIRGDEFELMHTYPLPDVKESKHEFAPEIKLDFDSGYFFGAYIGDGWVSDGVKSGNRHALLLADANGKVIEKVQQVIDSYLIDGNIHVCSVDAPHKFHEKDSFCIKRTWYSSKFSSLLRDHIGAGATNKRLPDFWMQTAASFRWGLLSGLIDTDGSISKSQMKKQTNVNFSTISYGLAYGMVGLAHSLDMSASVTVGQTPSGDVNYLVSFTQESILKMKNHLWLANQHKMDVLNAFELSSTGTRNKYTPKLSTERLKELRKAIGSPRLFDTMSDEEVTAIKKRKSLYVILHRIEKQNTAISRLTALEIFKVLPDFFLEGFWSKWKELVLDENIEWELVTEISPIPFITEAYDLTVPPNYTMVTESGIVVYDTMSVHVPLSAKAKQEVYDRLMPSKNLINPTNGSMIAELKHEMSLGIFYSTRDRMPVGQNVTFKDFKALEEAYNAGEVKTYQPVTMNVPYVGTVRATCGQHLFNQALAAARAPKQYIDFEKNVNMDAKKVRRLLEQINADKKGGGPMVTTAIINHLRRIGFKTATQSGMSIGLRDFDNIAKVNKQQLLAGAKDDKAFQASLKKSNPGLYQAVYDKPVALQAKQAEAFEQAKSNFVLNTLKGMVDTKGKTNLLGSDNPVSIMMASGARGNAGQIVGMGGMVGVGKDVENKTTMPVHSSLIEGLRPDEFFTMSSDARKGIFDKSIATQDPGALTRQIWFANRQTVIAAEDCGDKMGVELDLHDDLRHLRGRVLLQPVKLGLGSIPVTGKPITFQEFEKIQQAVKSNKTDQKSVKVRSPLTCKSSHGICQKCYGARADANNDELVPIGEAVGSIAAQALGEPSQQAIMRTFHSGAGQSSTTNAFEQIKNVLELSSTAKPNTAVVAKKAGVITKIDKHPFTGTTIVVGDATYKLGSLAINPQLRVGVHVDACDSLTDPMSTHINPRDVLALRGEKAAQNYLIDTVTDAFKMGNIDDTDRRHLELTVGNMTNRAIVEDPGSTGFLAGQTVRKNVLTLENKKTRVKGGYQASLLESNKRQIVGKTAARDVKSLRGGRIIVKQGETVTEQIFQALKADGRRYVMISDAQAATYTPQLFGVQNDTKMADGNWLGNAAFRNSKSHLLRGAAIGSEDKLADPLTRQMTGMKGNFSGGYGDWVNEVNEQFAGLF